MSAHKYYFRYTLISLLMIVLLFGVFSPFLVRVGINIGNYYAKAAHVEIQAKGISGNLRHFKIDTLVIKMPGEMIQLKQLNARWHPLGLWQKKIRFSALSATESSVLLTPAKTNAKEKALPIKTPQEMITLSSQKTQQGRSWPIEILFEHLDTPMLQVGIQGQKLWNFGHRNIDLILGKPKDLLQLYIHKQRVKTLDLTMDYDGYFTLWLHHQNVTLQRPLDVHIKLKGSLAHYSGAVQATYALEQNHVFELKAPVAGDQDGFTLEQIQGHFAQQKFGQVQGMFKVSWQDTLAWNLDLNGAFYHLDTLMQKFPAALNINWHSSGDQNQRQIMLNTTYNQISSLFEATGYLQDQSWHYHINQWNIKMPLKAWHLQAPVKLENKNASFGFSKACMVANASKLCFNMLQNKQGQSFSVDIKNLRLDSIDQSWLHWRSSGLLNGSMHYDNSDDKNGDATIKLDLINPTIEYIPNINTSFVRSKIYLSSASIDASLKRQKWHINTLLKQGDQNTVKAAIALQNMRASSPEINATVTVDIKNLQGLKGIDSNIKTLAGKVSGQYSIAGSVEKPLIKGKLHLQDGRFALRAFDFMIDPLNASLSANGGGSLALVATGKSAPSGQVDLNGQIDFSGNRQANIKLNAQNLQVYHNLDRQVLVNAQLAMNYLNQVITIIGKLEVPSAFINLAGIQNSASLGPDVVFISDQHKKASVAITYKLNIDTIIKNLVLQGLGLNVQLKGELAVKSQDLNNYYASGNLKLEKGSYQAYGKGFRLDSGLIFYKNNAINNPNLDISASYVLNEIKAQVALQSLKVMVHIFGSVLNPQTVLSSNPSMSQEDILAYILFGQPLSNLQGSQGAALSRAILLLSLQGHQNGSFLTSIQKQFGLSQLTLSSLSRSSSPATSDATGSGYGDISEQESNDTALFIGKSLSDRLFVSYGVGLFNQQQTFRSRLELSKKWQLITYTGTDQNAVDLLYHIDRKKKD